MSLKFTVDDINSVDEAFRPLYVESNGKHVLAVEGAVSKDRLDEFRSSNVATRKELDALRAQYDGVDVEQYRTLTTQAEKLRDKKLLDAGKVDELIEARVAAMRGEHKTMLDGLTAERNSAKSQLEGLLIDGALRDAAAKANVRATAIEDVLLRGRSTFRVADGKATAYDGDKAMYGKDSEPLTVSDWVSGLAERAPHLFDTSSGGSSPKHGSTAVTGGAKNTMTRAQYDEIPIMDRAAAVKGKTIVD